MNRTTFLATLVGIAGISLSVHANEPNKKCICKPGACKKAECKDCKCKAGKPSGHHRGEGHHGERHPHARLTPEQIKKLKAAKERYLREVAKIVGREKMEMWRRMQEQGHRGRLPERRESGRPGSNSGRPGSSKGRPSGPPNKVEGNPTRPNLRKPTKN